MAYVTKDQDADVIYLGAICTRLVDSASLVRTRQSKATHLICIYEAGLWVPWLSLALTQKGHCCGGVSPSVMPNKAGDRVNTDRRDAVPLAQLLRSGDVPLVFGPQLADEAIRDLTGAREDLTRDGNALKFRLKACMLRHDSRYTGRATWSPAHLRWHSEAVCPPTPAQPIVLQAYVRAVSEQTVRLQRSAHTDQVQFWRLPPAVNALQALCGVPCTGAVTALAALGDLTRVTTPRQLITCLGLRPSEYARGERRRQRSITNVGNPHARRALVEGAWASQHPTNVSRHLPLRLETQPTARQDISWKAHARWCIRYRRLMARGQHANQVVAAIAHGLVGFLWAIAKQVAVTP